MTNGENLKNIYPDLEIIREIEDVYVIMLETHNVCSPKLEVFKSWWNAEYKEPTTNNLGDDCVSRKAVLEITAETGALETQNRVKALPSVTSIRPKGHWIDKFGGVYRCSCCREIISIDTVEFPYGITYKYCPYCGSYNSVKIEK